MRCHSCGKENLDKSKFCIQCGVPLEIICRVCGARNIGNAKYCTECGDRLLDADIDTSVETPGVESRQVTILFCDIVDYSSLSERLEPEELHDLVSIYQQTCAQAVNHFGGYLAKYLGDGLLIYFGYPRAHEDDAKRAVKASLRILSSISESNAIKEKLGRPLTLRIGIHTGQVVAGEMGVEGARETMAVLGEAPNIASRLMNAALPNTILISSSTYKLVEGLFNCRDMGKKTLKGVSNRVHAHQVLEESDQTSRFGTPNQKRLTPFVGRDIDLELLLERWEYIKAGSGQVVMITGEAGIGKSRLVQVFKRAISGEQFLKVESHCSHYYKNSALHPIIENLNRQFLHGKDSLENIFSLLEQALQKHSFSLDETISLLAPLLSLPIPERYSAHNLTPEKQKQKTMECLLAWSLAESQERPVLRIIEDLQWVDPSTLDYLTLLIDQLPGSKIFLLLTSRPDFHAPWKMRPYITNISLNRLTRNQMNEMVNGMNANVMLPAEFQKQIIDRADGIPLFVEELFKMLSESALLKNSEGSNKSTVSENMPDIPMTLKDSLMARLDSIGSYKELAQLSAALGREFNYDLISRVSSLNQNELMKQLQKLVDSEILLHKGSQFNSRYIFKHHLIQDAAYQSMLKSKRQQHHNKIANVLMNELSETTESNPELIAYHLTNAEQNERAADYWHRAGKRAIERSNHTEAVNHLNAGLRIINILPDNQDMAVLELETLLLLGAALRVTKGFASPEVQSVYSRARKASKGAGDVKKLLSVLRGASGYYLASAKFAASYELGEESLRLAENERSTEHLIQAHYILGASKFCMGDFSSAKEHSGKGISLYDPKQHSSGALLYGPDPGVSCLFWNAWAHLLLGYPDMALEKGIQALEHAKEISHPYSLAIAHDLLGFIHQFRGEVVAAYENSMQAINISQENGFELSLEMGSLVYGWALFQKGQEKEGLSLIEESFDEWTNTGAQIICSYWTAFLAESYLRTGHENKGLNLINTALSEENEEKFYRAELYRLKGELLESSGNEKAEAESCICEAIEIARQQNAKSLELRAAISLCRLYDNDNKYSETLKELQNIYTNFDEGFETLDLTAARTILENPSLHS